MQLGKEEDGRSTGQIHAPSSAPSLWPPGHTVAVTHCDTNSLLTAPRPWAHEDSVTSGHCTWGLCEVDRGGSDWSHSTPCLSLPWSVPFSSWLCFTKLCQCHAGPQHSTAVSGLVSALQTPQTQHLSHSHQQMVRAMLQTPCKKSQKVGKKWKKALIPQGEAEQHTQTPDQRPWSSRQQQVHAPHASPDAGWTLWKFKIPDGSFWVGFFCLASFPRQQDSLSSASCHRDFT